ncbi:winged helix-turn-helix domain-containing protein [Luteimonas composti]|uniref:Winged helix-turn-helix domain-containing protein n=1 Tax=Luteimonas composti TaxID=398257 RepID=A0ABT6MRI1_9GAMM|nr:winged helix-turn-helix domain-containing protein [Luteimonas composti]MDH7453063.1 winged helix-turn-helix domain-containing protein [Luteimonas composti]
MIRPAASRLRVLDCEVDALRRVVARADGSEGRRLTLKAMQVLLVLVEHAGSVVTRETLFQQVWPDTMPTDDVLTQAIAQLRKAFGDDRDAPRYIETIARTGYRLLAPATWLEEPEPKPVRPDVREDAAAVADDTVPVAPAPGPRLSLRVLAGVVALVLAAGAWLWTLAVRDAPARGSRERAPELDLAYRAIVSTPGQERLPALSPDGATVAFAQTAGEGGSVLMLQTVGQTAARPLTAPGEVESDTAPAWSRDGTRIAFVRISNDSCRFMLVAASGGEPREAGPCLHGSWSQFDWTPDGRGLVMGGQRSDGAAGAALHRLDFATGRWQPLAYDVGEGDVDQLPRYSPDGRMLAFRRNLSLADLWVMSAEGGTPRPLTRLRGDIRGWDWLPDGSGLVLSHVASQSTLWLLRLEDGSMQALPRPPVGNAVYPDVAADAWSMVFEVDQSRSGLFRARLDGVAEAAPEPVFASSGVDLLPALSPDGRTLAFLSDRSMAVQLWLGEVDQPATLRAVEGLQPLPRHAPVWSADGRSLLVLGRTGDGERLFEVDAGSGRVQMLAVPAARPVFAAYVDRADRLLVGVDDGRGRVRLVLYGREGWRELASEDDVGLARYDAGSGAVLFTRPSAPGLWRTDASLHGSVRISDALPDTQHYRHWGLHAGRVYSIGPESGCATPWRPLLAPGPGRCLFREGMAVGGSPTVDAQGRWLYLGLPMSQNVDIGWGALPQALREPPAESSRAARTLPEVTENAARSMTFGCDAARCRRDFVLVS